MSITLIWQNKGSLIKSKSQALKQVLQNLKTGLTKIVALPHGGVSSLHLLVQSRVSLISIGTERMLVDFGRANLLDKARQQPDKVKQVLEKVKTDGLVPTIQAVRSKLDQALPMGYSNVGQVIEMGKGTKGFNLGDRVVSNGPHAELVTVNQNLCARIPDSVSNETASFTIVGSIALQGIRLIAPTIGERVVVSGLGLIGLLAVQILRANGCEVLGIDFDEHKCRLAEQFGAESINLSKGGDPVAAAEKFSHGRGVDAVLITASTKSNELIHQAAQMCRKRGRIVLVGVVGLDLQRADFYEKELTFQVSCSYGPGRYDPDYENKGQDYPFGFVRWTEQRNFEAVLGLMARGAIQTEALVSHRFAFSDAVQAYETVSDKAALGILLDYGSGPVSRERTIQLVPKQPTTAMASASSVSRAVIGMIGAGGFTGQVLLPALRKTSALPKVIVSSGGVSGTHFGKKFGFAMSSTDSATVLEDSDINGVMITTRHNSHSRYVLDCMERGKAVFVEKPLCLTFEELTQIEELHAAKHNAGAPARVMVGFNRRFSPFSVKMRELLEGTSQPKSIICTINAGKISAEHWTQDPEVGGGRIIGEACHFIDFCRYLVGKPIEDASIQTLDGGPADKGDTATIQLTFVDGSIATIHYFANGSKSFPKERVEVFCEGKILQLDNFKKLRGFGWRGFSKMKTWSQQKGHAQELAAWVASLENGTPSPIPFEEIVEVTRVTLDLALKPKIASQHS